MAEPLFKRGEIWMGGLVLQTGQDHPCVTVSSLAAAEQVLRKWREEDEDGTAK